MYQRSLLVLTLALPFVGMYAQNTVSQSIEWSAPSLKSASSTQKSPEFKGANYDLENPNLAKYCGRIEGVGGKVTEGTLDKLSFVDVDPAELKSLESLDLKATPEVSFTTGYLKGQPITSYCFYPYVKVNGQIRKVSSFELNYSISNLSRSKTSGGSTFVSNSVLNSGKWYKISIEESGVYKVSHGFLESMGVDMDNLQISSVAVYGNGQAILPESNDAFRKDDLQEIPCKAVDNNGNGQFDANDYLLFYGLGPHQWFYDNGDQRFEHIQNFYRDENFYFINTEALSVNRITSVNENAGPAGSTVTVYDDYDFKEDELENLVGTGRVWLGDLFDFTSSYNYGFNFPDISTTEAAKVRVNIVGRSAIDGTFIETRERNVPILTNALPAYTPGPDQNVVVKVVNDATFLPTANTVSLNLSMDRSVNPAAVAWLDYIELQVRRNLFYRSGDLSFRDIGSVGAGNVTRFEVSNANGALEVWDVTDINNAFSIQGDLTGGVFGFNTRTDSLRQFVALSGGDFPTPAAEGAVEQQNLHAHGPVDMIIVTHPNFQVAADRLADFHRNTDQITVQVVDVFDVYNEFSSGGQDITAIRDYVRMIYERANAAGSELKYLLLMGDASYDYKDRLANNNNYVPIWESASSFSLTFSWISDDYYGYLDPGEGDELTGVPMDVSIGRIPCETVAQANSYIDKVVNYITGDNRFGDWRNKILLTTDDADVSRDALFLPYSETLEERVRAVSGSFNVEKIYMDAYKQTSTTGSQYYPEARQDLFRKVQLGNLVTNYIGHGGEIGLSSERFLQLSDINSWTNFDALPLFITITCEFTRVDDPKRVSAGEQLLFNPRGGAVALISTTRVVGDIPAMELNQRIFDFLLTRDNDRPLTFGEVTTRAKNARLNDGTKLKFSLFGDPAIRLAIPHFDVQTTAVNNADVTAGGLDTLKALSKVEIEGQVVDLSGQKLSAFNGLLNVSVFDKPSDRSTLNNDGAGSPQDFQVQSSLIYKGKVEVVNGDFAFEFLVPFDISYQFGFGKISYYAQDGASDAAGNFDTIVVGGFNPNPVADETGPEIELFMNDDSFVRGGVTGTDPKLFARVSDSSGINTVGNGIGHDIVAVLDEKTENSFVINEYYEADLNSYQSGEILYPFFNLETGSHTLRLRVFDVHNNFSEAKTEFIVAEDAKLALERVLNYPNPFTTYTEFQFEHNRANQPLDVQVQIFTVSGKLVKTINTAVTPTGNRVTGIAWNGLDDYGDKIGKGVYVYRLNVRSPFDNIQAEEYEKLVILR